ncbi:MAG TPA: VOC family protein [Trebonia sp.]|nr:VOC family protein [Trebonia sp.]
MDFVSVRIITSDVARLASFYERVTGARASRLGEDFAELRTARATLAIGSERTVGLLAPGAARPASNHAVIIEFLVDDVDRVHQDLAGFLDDVVTGPTTMPWGNRSLLFRDPDGNLVNFFTPVTPAAIEKFSRLRPTLSSWAAPQEDSEEGRWPARLFRRSPARNRARPAARSAPSGSRP